MRFVIYGAGAIGGVVGGRLFQAGHDVTLVARGAHLEALRTRGLVLESAGTIDTLAVPAVARPADAALRPGDVVILAMKAQGTLDAVRALAACAPPDIRVVCAQNGLENERVALRLFADVYAVNVVCPATHLEPGVVRADASPVSGLLDLGRYPAGVDDVTTEVAATLAGATFAAQARPDIMRWKHAKLLNNLGNAIDAVCGRDRSDATRALSRRVRAEGEACLAAAGLDAASRDEDQERRRSAFPANVTGGSGQKGSSTWQSLARGAGEVETDYLTGEIVLLGRLHGVPTPANTLLQSLAARLVAEGAPPGTIPAAEVLDRLDQPDRHAADH